ncbi:MAG TPA: hypothetical protein VJ719_08035, partial [Chthoniobacterales bacterium]|nr:hypothetical protein [Chthoniobacterales bacterium]
MFVKRWWIFLLSAVLAFSCVSEHGFAAEKIRPTGVPAPASDDEEDSTPKPKSATKKKSTKRSSKKSKSDYEAPVATLPNGVPITRAKSVLVIDAQTGQT